MAITETSLGQLSTKASGNMSTRHLIGPVADFVLLGGGSVIPLLLVAYFWPSGSDTGELAAATMLIANLVNHPHFAHSYQLFYRDFASRGFGTCFPDALRWRYLFAALGVPLLLVGFFGYCLATGNPTLLGKAANLMFFLVGWHYVKQGFGMLMVDAALKRNFFDARQKRWLLWNAYSVWATSWLLVNQTYKKHEYWGLNYYTFGIPDWLMTSAFVVLAITTLLALIALSKKLANWRHMPMPLNGMIAYLTSLYLWLLVRHPAMLLVIPAFHSLQYLAVVWRYRLNIEKDKSRNNTGIIKGRGPWPGFLLFIFLGLVLGYLAFWRIPYGLDAHLNYDREVYGGALSLFIFWIFINVHHYFLDNVMWRKDNPDTRRYLFGAT